jgi:hypothetical protein
MINVKLIIRYWILDTRYWMNKAAKFAPIFDIQHPVSIRCSELMIMFTLQNNLI